MNIAPNQHPAIKAMGLISSMVRSGRISSAEREMLEAVIAPAAEAEIMAEREAAQEDAPAE